MKAWLAAALALWLTIPAAHGQARCEDDADKVIEEITCVEWRQRFYSTSDFKGIEEDSIIGIQTADVTVDHDDLLTLDTARITLVAKPGEDKYLLTDWVVIVKTDSDGVPDTRITGNRIGVTVDSATGGTLDYLPDISWRVDGISDSIFKDGLTFVRRYTPFIGEGSVADTPIILAMTPGIGPGAGNWDDTINELDTDVTLRFIIRYRIIDTDTSYTGDDE